jgi:hypothetical protein
MHLSYAYVCGVVLLSPAGAHLLEQLHEEMAHQGVQLGLCNPGGVRITLQHRTLRNTVRNMLRSPRGGNLSQEPRGATL